ncbi:MAG: GNAT family N-acetyltransferase [Oscillochloris sp.]|nr:GNAT family N-acetyltransferase [Oscillochloris sp.]
MFRWDLGDGVVLRVLELRHAEEFLSFVSTNRDYLGRWLSWGHTIRTVEDAQAFIRRGITRYAEDELPWVGIWEHGRMAGGLLFFPLDRSSRATEMGYWLGEGASGHGLMSRTARAILGLLFDELGLNRITLQVEVDNVRSCALAERLGFAFEGIRRQAGVNGARLVDMASYALLVEDWRHIRR